MGKFFAQARSQLTTYVRFLAWLNAVPKPDARSKRAKSADAPTATRLEQMKARRINPRMPPNPLPHLLGWLIEIGLTQPTGMGVSPLCWSEIDAWQRMTAIELSPWEAQTIRSLSAAYIAEGRRAESENCPPPWRAEVSARERQLDEAQLRAVLG